MMKPDTKTLAIVMGIVALALLCVMLVVQLTEERALAAPLPQTPRYQLAIAMTPGDVVIHVERFLIDQQTGDVWQLGQVRKKLPKKTKKSKQKWELVWTWHKIIAGPRS